MAALAAANRHRRQCASIGDIVGAAAPFTLTVESWRGPMRFAIRIATAWRPLFALFGFRPESSYVELDDQSLVVSFGTAKESIPLQKIAGASRRNWPFFYGLGPKLGPKGGVSYVGSTSDVVEIRLAEPCELNVWGPFRRKNARCVTVSIENADAFVDALQTAIAAR